MFNSRGDILPLGGILGIYCMQYLKIEMHMVISDPSTAEATFVHTQERNDFLKASKPCHIGIHWIVITE